MLKIYSCYKFISSTRKRVKYFLLEPILHSYTGKSISLLHLPHLFPEMFYIQFTFFNCSSLPVSSLFAFPHFTQRALRATDLADLVSFSTAYHFLALASLNHLTVLAIFT